MRVLLIDDEQPAIDELTWLLSRFEDVTVVGTYLNPKKALEAILLESPDVVFLDVQMPEMDGFALAETLLGLREPPKVIFVTAYDDYALQAFEINAVDYLLKPVMEDRLKLAIDKVRPMVGRQASVETLIKDRYLTGRAKRLPLWKDDRIYLISPQDLVYLECKEGETSIYTMKGTFRTSECLNHYEEILSHYGFFRCHRSFIIRLDAITEIIPWFNHTYQVKVHGFSEAEIPVSRRNAKEFKLLLQL